MRPRIRSVKPDIFHDEQLWALGEDTHMPILQGFQGLWCYADREGRFEWRPLALKSLILPYWRGDFEELLGVLVGAAMVVRYVVDGRVYGWVRNFAKHQAINNKELPSTLPEPPSAPVPIASPRVEVAWSSREPRVNHASSTPAKGIGNGIGIGSGNGLGSGLDPERARDASPPNPSSEPEPVSSGSADPVPSAKPPKPYLVPSAADTHQATWTNYPPGWRWNAETEAAASIEGVSAEHLQEHVDYWTTHVFPGRVRDLDGELRRSLGSIRTRAETARAKTAALARALPRAGPGGRGSERGDVLAMMAEELAQQRAEEAARRSGGKGL